MFKFLAALSAVAVLAGPVAAQSRSPAATDPNRLFADSKIVVRDRFSDEILGKGPDLIFMPGLASSRATWKAQAGRLRGRYRVHLLQVAGFAGEPARANATGEVLIPTAEAIDAYLAEQKLTPAAFIGHSLGGTTLIYLAEHHPEHYRKALVVDALPFFGAMQNPEATLDSVKPTAVQMRATMLAGAGKTTPESLMPQMRTMSKDTATQLIVARWGADSDRKVVAEAMYDDLMLDLRADLPKIRTPITLVYPDNTPMGVPAGRMEKVYPALYATAPTVKPVLVANSLHFVMLDQPEAFNAVLDAFLAQK